MTDKVKQEIKRIQNKRTIEVNRIKELYKLAQVCHANLNDSVKLSNFKIRYGKRETICDTFNNYHAELVGLMARLDDAEADYPTEDLIRSSFDDIYYNVESIYLTCFSNESKPVLSPSLPCPGNTKTINAKLPKLSLPTFNGHIKEWCSFIDLFNVLVHQNADLSNIEKFQYLINSLSGEPLTVVRTLPLNDVNYSIAYNSLYNRYQNRRFQGTHYWNEIMNAPKLNSENPQALRHLLDVFYENAKALENLGFPVTEWDFIMLNLLIKKLDSQTVKRFELQYNPVNPANDIPKYQELVTFLNKQCAALDSAALTVGTCASKTFSRYSIGGNQFKSPSDGSKSSFGGKLPKGTSNFLVQSSSSDIVKCPSCDKIHSMDKCSQFLQNSPKDRYGLVKQKKLCVNCFGSHMVRNCKSPISCSICKRRHNYLLHFNSNTSYQDNRPALISSETQTVFQANSADCPKTGGPSPVNVFANVTPSQSMVLLATANVAVVDVRGIYQTVRVLLDSASQSSFITDRCLNRMGLPRRKLDISILGLGQMSSQSSGVASCTICPLSKSALSYQIDVISVPKICSYLPHQWFSVDSLSHICELSLADDKFNQPGPVDMLLGADLFPLILRNGQIEGNGKEPSAINTVFGWVIMGKISLPSYVVNTFFTSSETPLDVILKKFWEVEETSVEPVVSPDDGLCEKIYSDAVSRDETGRYTVSLPFKDGHPRFGGSKEIALKRFYLLERRLLKSPLLYSAYSEFMQEYLDSGHMDLKGEDSSTVSDAEYFIPHHCVLKPDSTTTKLRVVFDASAKDTNGLSLNDTLFVGPKLQKDIFSLLLNFRYHAVVFTADIKQMYRQIWITKSHRNYQKIFWRFSQDEPVREYILNTVTYGVASSPFLALRTIVQLANDEGSEFPEASRLLETDTFVDDLISGSDNLESALRLQSDLINLLKRGGFSLRKWASNHRDLLQALPTSDCQQDLSFHSTESIVKILGLKWLPNLDVFSYSCEPRNEVCTKRAVLSELARIFDPLGFVAPISFFAKYLIQYLWTLGVDWDQPVPEKVANRWCQFQSELHQLKGLSIPRRLIMNQYNTAEIHGFCDSSEKGYAAVVYFRFFDDSKIPKVFLVCAKTKISPLKRISIPRLELCGAVLLAKLLYSVISSFSAKITFHNTFAWCDSTTVLFWIKSSPHRWKTFVSNRVTQIQSKISPTCWHYIASRENPADCASRGLFPSELVNHSLWWAGPSWLYSEDMPLHEDEVVTDCAEEGRMFVLASLISSSFLSNLLTKYSSLGKLKRIIAYCSRFLFNCQNSHCRRTNGLDLSELNDALMVFIKYAQNEFFSKDIVNLQTRRIVSNQLKRLNPFLDDLGILRVGGRLKNSEVSYNYKHPILLPRQGRLTQLIIEDIHRENFHPGLQTTHFLILQNFWILNPKRAIRNVLGNCIRCFKVNPTPINPQMGNIPPFRVNQLKCFSHVGVDMGGPFLITPNRTRGTRTLKAYLCLFVCCSTKALHLELTSDLSAESFLAAFRRFIARRGRVVNMYSDCGTNFIASSKYLQEIMKSAFETEKISWSFSPPAAPHFNGLSEAGIKSVKTHINRVVGDQILTYEELNTLIIQIESMLNSRPLSPISSDPNDLLALTPGHFLLLEPLTALPDFDLTTCKLNSLTRWQLLIRMNQDFWKRWRDEYLHTLTQRYKWNTPSQPLKIDMLVVLKNEQTPPLKWKLGRIINLHPGSDGICRVVTVKTTHGTFKRPVQAVKGENELKVVHGEEVSPHSLPYMAALKLVNNGRNIRCGGSLISTTKVLTAASCLTGAEKVTVVLGAHNLEEKEDTKVILESSNFTIHEDYDFDSHLNDIALVILPEEVKNVTGIIETIATPSLADILKTYADDLGMVAGWGRFSDTDSGYSNVLRKIEATIIPYLSCTIPYLFAVKTTQICTSGMQESQNVCTGDSGGPLVVEGVQVGIVSYGSDFGCSVGAPGVHTRLTSYYAWLTAH